MSHQKGIEAERATEAELAALAKGLLAPTTTRSEMSQVWEKLKSFADPHWPRAARPLPSTPCVRIPEPRTTSSSEWDSSRDGTYE